MTSSCFMLGQTVAGLACSYFSSFLFVARANGEELFFLNDEARDVGCALLGDFFGGAVPAKASAS